MKTRKPPMRRCIGCMESKPKGNLIRVAYYDGELSVDPTGKADGRGVYICMDAKCMALAKKKKALQRNLRAELTPEQIEKIFEELKAYEK